jgi:hypothetical protein
MANGRMPDITPVSSGTCLENAAREGDSPVDDRGGTCRKAPKYRGARGILRESGRTTS